MKDSEKRKRFLLFITIEFILAIILLTGLFLFLYSRTEKKPREGSRLAYAKEHRIVPALKEESVEETVWETEEESIEESETPEESIEESVEETIEESIEETVEESESLEENSQESEEPLPVALFEGYTYGYYMTFVSNTEESYYLALKRTEVGVSAAIRLFWDAGFGPMKVFESTYMLDMQDITFGETIKLQGTTGLSKSATLEFVVNPDLTCTFRGTCTIPKYGDIVASGTAPKDNATYQTFETLEEMIAFRAGYFE